jgi:hypothetical protein
MPETCARKAIPIVNLFTSEANPPAIEQPVSRATIAQRFAQIASRAVTARNAFLLAGVALAIGLSVLLIQRTADSDGSIAAAQPRVAAVPAIAYRSIDDDPSLGAGGVQLFYSGSWQHVRGKFDGRDGGTSSRSFRVGSEVSFQFHGERFDIFGIRGSNGGYADVVVDGSPAGTISFVAKHKTVGTLVYASRTLDEGAHWVQIFVIAPPDGKRGFVNIDRAVFGSRPVG